MKGIYKITFPNGKYYIGQSNNLISRQQDYLHWQTRSISQTALYRAFLKYNFSIDMFKIIVENDTLTQDDLDTLEIMYIKQYNSIVPNGYNIQKGGNNKSGYRQLKNILDILNSSDINQPVINIKINKEYNNPIEWALKENLNAESIYDLYLLRGDWEFKYLDKVQHYYGEGYPDGTTLADIKNNKVTPQFEYLTETEQDEKIEKNTNDIALLKKEIEQLKLENQALKENRKCKEYIL